MQFSKPMIELVYALRRSVPADMKPAIKLANPELFEELAHYYHDKAPAVNKALIKELFFLAGEPWVNLLAAPAGDKHAARVKVYRGQVSHEERGSSPRDSSTDSRPKRIYRGRVVT